VVFLGAAGVVGLLFLRRALLALMLAANAPEPEVAPALAPPTQPALEAAAPVEAGLYRSAAMAGPRAPAGYPARRQASGLRIFRMWLVAYAVVGAQMGWLLRPFVGQPGAPFTFFRPREGSFFLAVLHHLFGFLK
jgi:hypothetical protein